MPPVTAATGAAAGGAAGSAAGGAAKIGKGAEAAKKAGSSGGKANSNLPEINRQSGLTNAQNFLRGRENSAENGGENEGDSENLMNFTGFGRGRNSESGGRFSFRGKQSGKIDINKLKKGAPIILALGVMLLPILLIFGTGSLLFADIDENTQESMDVQYTAMRAAAKIALKMALENGSLPSPLAERLTDSGLEVGYLDDSGTFIAGLRPVSDTKVASTTTSESLPQDNLAYASNPEEDNSLVLRFKDKIITSSEWIAEFENNAEIYAAFDEATYGRAAGHYDDIAETFYSNINASRNVFANFSSTDETRDFREILGEYYTNNPTSGYEVEPNETSVKRSSNTGDAKKDALDAYFDELFENTLVDPDKSDWDSYPNESEMFYDKAQAATLAYLVNNALNANETYESMKYFLTLEEVMGKAKAGDGYSAPINEMLNYLTASDENNVSAVQSSTLSSVLTKSFDGYYSDDESKDEIKPYSIDRLHQIINKYMSVISDDGLKFALSIAGISWSGNPSNPYGIKDNEHSILKLLPEKDPPVPPACTRYPTTSEYYDATCEALWQDYDKEYAEYQEYLKKKDPTYHPITMRLINDLKAALSADSSKTTFLTGDGFNTVVGSHAGELFSKGASILGSKIATFGQGGTSSTESSATAYQKETNRILALDAAADRLDKSPFDITSQNTFLGSIVHSFSNYLYTTPSLSSGFSSFSSILRNSFTSLLPGAFADSEASFQTSFGECPENDLYGNGFVCSTFSYPTVSFDVDYITNYIEGNPSKPDNADEFIEFNNNRTANVGYLNDKTIEKLAPSAGGKVKQFFTFLKNKITQFANDESRFKDYFSTKYIAYSEEQLAIAAGTAFTDGGQGAYKDAQAYSVLSRFLIQAGYFSKENTNPTAFSEGFDRPGTGESPYLALLKETSTDFSTLSDAEYLAAISGMSENEANIVLGYFAYETYLASIDYENRLAFGKEETFDFENSIQFEYSDPIKSEFAILVRTDNQKVKRKEFFYVA